MDHGPEENGPVRDQAYRQAEKRVKARFGFYTHAAVYLGVMILLLIINLVNSPDQLWFQWPLLGWGIGLFFHGLSALRVGSSRLAAMQEKAIAKEMDRQGGRNGPAD